MLAVTLLDGFCNVYDSLLKHCLSVILMHQALAVGLGTSACCANVAVLVLLLDATPLMQPALPLLDLVKYLLDTQMSS
jgi:hypothetical protein